MNFRVAPDLVCRRKRIRTPEGSLLNSQPDPRRWKALALLCVAFFMVILDAQIVILGLPSIEAELGFSADGAQWVPVRTQVNRNSNGYPIVVADGVEYSQCR